MLASCGWLWRGGCAFDEWRGVEWSGVEWSGVEWCSRLRVRSEWFEMRELRVLRALRALRERLCEGRVTRDDEGVFYSRRACRASSSSSSSSSRRGTPGKEKNSFGGGVGPFKVFEHARIKLSFQFSCPLSLFTL